MKKILVAVAAACAFAAAPAAFAGVDVFVDLGLPRPLFVAPPQPVVYYRPVETRWHDHRGHFDRRDHFDRRHEYRERHEHFRGRDWR